VGPILASQEEKSQVPDVAVWHFADALMMALAIITISDCNLSEGAILQCGRWARKDQSIHKKP